MEETKEIWNVEDVLENMRKFCVHVRFQAEKMEQDIARIRLEIQENKKVV